ncbi:MAG: uracil-DNA glycosylase [Ruminococcaceae bacterium]|nr:uracil-DNA glycosylase [Oscillospiraceae bacterium]
MANAWSDLRDKCTQCKECQLFEKRTNVVFGDGNPMTDIMFIGEGPGEQEDIKGRAFVGPAGLLLDRYLDYIGLDRTKIYIANIVKCRPPQNRDPLEQEQEICMQWLRAQVRLIRPKIIVCLGRIAAKKLIGPDFRITVDHGKWFERGSFHIIATYHPAALLRAPDKKGEALDDFLEIEKKMNELGLFGKED